MAARIFSAVVGLILVGTAGAAEPPALVKKTHVHKTVAGVKIQAEDNP